MIRELNRSMDIPLSLKGYGVSEEDFRANVKSIAHNAVLDACTGSNPRPIDDATMEKVLEYIYEGKDIDF
ncbi:MAG: hypothetical protein KatS3mg079_082 [Caloramator sp.]|nr:MAG: hypothetical protein KatS3mg079_082 [Caloramator sp.]